MFRSKTHLFLCFIDYVKAFDRVQRHNLKETLHNFKVEEKDIRINKNLYKKMQAPVRVEDYNRRH